LSKKPNTLTKDRNKAAKSHFRVNDTKSLRLRHNPEKAMGIFALEPSRTEEALQLLTRRLLHAQEDERRSVARELHDGLNQTLAMLGVEVGIALNQLPGSAKSVRQQLQRILMRVEQLTEEVREISHRLHPALLEHLGLVSALRSYCSEFEQCRRLDVLFVCEGSADQMPFQIAVCLYRIVQEALCNAAKHSNAREVVVSLFLSKEETRLSIVDDGRGFDVIQPGQNSGLGLISMEERAKIVGGRFSIDSHMGAGTRIEVVVPAKEASKWELLSEISLPAR
jgi:signal transduction histidine kinase